MAYSLKANALSRLFNNSSIYSSLIKWVTLKVSVSLIDMGMLSDNDFHVDPLLFRLASCYEKVKQGKVICCRSSKLQVFNSVHCSSDMPLFIRNF